MIDYHIHSTRSGDAFSSMSEICDAAISRGLSEICFTEHVDFEPTDTCYGAFNYDQYKSEIDHVRMCYGDKITIRCGVEIDYQTRYRPQIRDFFDGKEFDYVVGAAHYVGRILLENHHLYFPGKQELEAYIPYFENTIEAIQTGWFDTIAHLDLCKRYGVRYFGHFNPAPFQNLITTALTSVVDQRMSLEINTSGLRQSPQDFYPCEEILQEFYRLGGKDITVGSDAHKAEDTGSGIAQALALAERIGFNHVNTYQNRKSAARHIKEVLPVA